MFQFSKSCRTIAFVVITAPAPALADDTPPCITNVGPDGIVFDQFFATLQAPNGFEVVSVSDFNGIETIDGTTSSDSVMVFPSLAFDDQITAYGLQASVDGEKTIVSFGASVDDISSSCYVTVIPFDAVRYDLADTAVGFCDFDQTAGVTLLEVGASTRFSVPDRLFETGSSAPSVASIISKSGSEFELSGASAGTANFVWSSEDVGNGALRGMCPVRIGVQP